MWRHNRLLCVSKGVLWATRETSNIFYSNCSPLDTSPFRNQQPIQHSHIYFWLQKTGTRACNFEVPTDEGQILSHKSRLKWFSIATRSRSPLIELMKHLANIPSFKKRPLAMVWVFRNLRLNVLKVQRLRLWKMLVQEYLKKEYLRSKDKAKKIIWFIKTYINTYVKIQKMNIYYPVGETYSTAGV